VLIAKLPSVERISAVWGLCIFVATCAGLVIGAVLDDINKAFFASSTGWVDRLWKIGLQWGTFAGGITYFFKWVGWA
jgi:hypothetical protein